MHFKDMSKLQFLAEGNVLCLHMCKHRTLPPGRKVILLFCLVSNEFEKCRYENARQKNFHVIDM